MAVHRRGLPPQQTEPTRVDLGRLLVSIDDLNALMDVLKAESQESDQIEIEFDGGSIDVPEDLRSLSDAELERLTIKAVDVEVLLSSDRAVAIGDENLCSAVYKLWARARRTRAAPEMRTRRDSGYSPIRSFLAIEVLVLFATVVTVIGNYFDTSVPSGEVTRDLHRDLISTTLNLVMGATVAGLIIFAARWLYKMYLQPTISLPPSFAIIKPLSNDELRKEVATASRYRLTTAITITGVVVATATAIVTKLVFK